MYYTIYKIVNKINGKEYIGKHQTKNLDDGYMGSGRLIRQAIEKYEKEAFKKEILFIFKTEEEMNTKEAELVTKNFVKEDTNYNLCPGGQGGWGYINSNGLTHIGHTKDSRRKASIKRNERKRFLHKNDREWHDNFVNTLKSTWKIKLKNGYVNSFTGKEHSIETKQKIGETNSKHQLGDKNSQYGTMWITNGVENRKIKKIDDIPKGWYKGRKMPIKE